MKLVQECTYNALLKPPVPIGAGPFGTRMYFEVTGGEMVGERLRGRILGGGEWALIQPDGFCRIDVRAQMRTHDDAFIYVQYTGLLEMNDAVQGVLAGGGGTNFGDQYFFTNPRFETGDPRYAWVNTTFFVGEGKLLEGPGVEYRLWRPA